MRARSGHRRRKPSLSTPLSLFDSSKSAKNYHPRRTPIPTQTSSFSCIVYTGYWGGGALSATISLCVHTHIQQKWAQDKGGERDTIAEPAVVGYCVCSRVLPASATKWEHDDGRGARRAHPGWCNIFREGTVKIPFYFPTSPLPLPHVPRE